MKAWIGAALCAATLFASARSAEAFLYVRGNDSHSGDLIAVWVKNGFELIVNLGPVEALGQGEVTSFEVPGEFDGDLIGAKFTALTVPNPVEKFSGGSVNGADRANIALTTLGDPNELTFFPVGDAQAVLDSSVQAQTWLILLGSIPAAGQPGVVENSDTAALIQTSLSVSYTAFLGFSSDAIANTITLSTAVFVAEGDGYAIPLYEVFQTAVDGPGGIDFGTEVTALGTLTGDDGTSGNAILSLTAPEPGTATIGGAALASLAWIARRRRSA
jgi:hypothetical protein